jgi:hypothetical protein
MLRHAGPFQLVLRRDTGGKALYYARFRSETGDLLPWVSTGEISKTAARAWVSRKHKAGSTTSHENLTFGTYAEK